MLMFSSVLCVRLCQCMCKPAAACVYHNNYSTLYGGSETTEAVGAARTGPNLEQGIPFIVSFFLRTDAIDVLNTLKIM